MKSQKILFGLLMVAFVLIGCKTEEPKQVAINISGMTCEIGCAKVIQSKLSKQEGVLDAKVVFQDSIATVKYDAAKTNKASLIAFVGGIAGNMYKAEEATIKKSCTADCKKDCCKNKEAKSCSKECEKECCKSKKSCDPATCAKACKDKKSCATESKKECSMSKEAKTAVQ